MTCGSRREILGAGVGVGALPEAALPVGALRVGGTDWGLAKVRPDPISALFGVGVGFLTHDLCRPSEIAAKGPQSGSRRDGRRDGWFGTVVSSD